MKKSSLCFLLILSMFLLTSCSQFKKIEQQSILSHEIEINTTSFIASATATPEPLLIVRKPSYSRSPMRIKLTAPEYVEIPNFYQLLDLPGVPYALYAYIDSENNVQYRVYADVDEIEDGHIINTITGFFAAEVYLTEGKTFTIETDKESYPVNSSSELPSVLTPCPAPTKSNIRNAIKTSANELKKYKSDCEKAARVGEATPAPPAWDGLPLLDESTIEIVLPSQLKAVGSKYPNLYYYINLYGDKEYRIYATADGYDSGFYLSDELGTIADGSLKIDFKTDLGGEYFKQRKTIPHPEDGLYRLPVTITLSNGLETTATVVYTKNDI